MARSAAASRRRTTSKGLHRREGQVGRPAPGARGVPTPIRSRRCSATPRSPPPAVQADQREPLGVAALAPERFERRRAAGQVPNQRSSPLVSMRSPWRNEITIAIGLRTTSAVADLRQEREAHRHRDSRATSLRPRARARSRVATAPCSSAGCGRMHTRSARRHPPRSDPRPTARRLWPPCPRPASKRRTPPQVCGVQRLDQGTGNGAPCVWRAKVGAGYEARSQRRRTNCR